MIALGLPRKYAIVARMVCPRGMARDQGGLEGGVLRVLRQHPPRGDGPELAMGTLQSVLRGLCGR